MMLSANPSGTIAMHYGNISESDFLIMEEYLPTLHNVHLADLLAAQFSSLMIREVYKIEDNIYPKPVCINLAQTDAGMEIQQYSDKVSIQKPYNELARPTNNKNLSPTQNQNVFNSQNLPGVLGLTVHQQNEPHSSSLQHQHLQLLPVNSQIIYKPSEIQIQLMRQSPRKMITGNNPMNIGAASDISNTINLMEARQMMLPLGTMEPPKLMREMNLHINLDLQQQEQQQQQAVVSPTQQLSQQQQACPQKMSQLSLSMSNLEACPGSPQLSS